MNNANRLIFDGDPDDFYAWIVDHLEDDRVWPEDELHGFFTLRNLDYWVDVANEGRRLYGALFYEGVDSVEEGSQIDWVLAAIAAAAETAAFKRIGQVLSVNWEELEERFSPGLTQDLHRKPPEPMSIDELVSFIKQHSTISTEKVNA